MPDESDLREAPVSASGSRFIDHEVGVRLKISALWVVLLFLHAYGDIFGFFKPGQIEDIVCTSSRSWGRRSESRPTTGS